MVGARSRMGHACVQKLSKEYVLYDAAWLFYTGATIPTYARQDCVSRMILPGV